MNASSPSGTNGRIHMKKFGDYNYNLMNHSVFLKKEVNILQIRIICSTFESPIFCHVLWLSDERVFSIQRQSSAFVIVFHTIQKCHLPLVNKNVKVQVKRTWSQTCKEYWKVWKGAKYALKECWTYHPIILVSNWSSEFCYQSEDW